MAKTIIYVFGPRRLAGTYFENKKMNLEVGGWLKIGQTTHNDDTLSVKESALNRIKQEVRTGIPEVCQIFDVFEYPESTGNTDDTIRNILTDKIYDLESSKKHNSDINIKEYKYQIKAGREFVYGVTRSQVLNAIAQFEHNLILKHHGTEDFETLMQCIKNNANAILDPADSDDISVNNSTAQDADTAQWFDALWETLKKQLSQINTTISIFKGRPYFLIYSVSHKGVFNYIVRYSVRSGLAYVGVETYGGEEKKAFIEDKIANATEPHPIKNIEAKQGVKNKDKWEWAISDTIDKTIEELIRWYADTILSLYRFFENKQ